MHLTADLNTLTQRLMARPELHSKRAIQPAARAFGKGAQCAWFADSGEIENGDDTAALKLGDEFVLLAAEGMHPDFVRADPWFAGFCAVMVNISDVAAMGGRPWAIVDVVWGNGEARDLVLEGLRQASLKFGVPIVGGHSGSLNAETALAAAIVGRARTLLRSSAARAGQQLLMAVDLRGEFRGPGGNFNAATEASAVSLRAALATLPELAERGLVSACKDISMAGTLGTVLMMLESANLGASVELGAVPAPSGVDPERWLSAFPSFGFVLSAEPQHVAAITARFDQVGVSCAVVGELDTSRRLELRYAEQRSTFWDLNVAELTGFGP